MQASADQGIEPSASHSQHPRPMHEEAPAAQHNDTGRGQHDRSRAAEAYLRPLQPGMANRDVVGDRSMTLPAELSGRPKAKLGSQDDYRGMPKWQEPGPTGAYYGPDSDIILPQRPATSNGARPSDKIDHELRNGYGPELDDQRTNRDNRGHVREDSFGDFFDSYHTGHSEAHETRPGISDRWQPTENEEMPNFDAISPQHADHLQEFGLIPGLRQEEPPRNMGMVHGPSVDMYAERERPFASQNSSYTQQSSHFKGRQAKQPWPDNNNSVGLDGYTSAPPMAVHVQPTPTGRMRPGHEWSGSANVMGKHTQLAAQRGEQRAGHHQQKASAIDWLDVRSHDHSYHAPAPAQEKEVQPEPSFGQGGQQTRTFPPMSPERNPDALPEHPVPVRPGLMQGSTGHTNPKPPPIRQYADTTSPVQQERRVSTNSASADPSQERKAAPPLTLDQLERLKQTARANPRDPAMQLNLAKTLVEAASVLADEGGRADPKTRSKNRERYILEAHKIVKKLVSAGNGEAMFYLADCYGQGLLGLEPDDKEAFSLYQSAAKVGHAASAYRVAVCCEVGQDGGGGTRRDPLKAVQWYRRAATLGDTPAMYKMGMILLKGLLGQPKNPKEAIVWLKRAAERADAENPHALHELVSNLGPGFMILLADGLSGAFVRECQR